MKCIPECISGSSSTKSSFLRIEAAMPTDEIPETGIARKNCHSVNSLGFQHRTHAGNGMILFIDFGKLMGFRAGDTLDNDQYLFFCLSKIAIGRHTVHAVTA